MGRLISLLGSAVILATVCSKIIGELRLKTRAEVSDGAAVVTLIIFAIAIMGGLVSRAIMDGLVSRLRSRCSYCSSLP